MFGSVLLDTWSLRELRRFSPDPVIVHPPLASGRKVQAMVKLGVKESRIPLIREK